MKILVALVSGCLFLLSACGGPDVVFEEQHDFGQAGWNYADSVSFPFGVADTSGRYDMVLTVDHGTDFAYQNFYVRLTTHLPDGRVLQQPLSLQLADNFGDWYGVCDGEACSTEIALQQGTRFTDPGEYRLVVTQYSREDPLAEVSGLGFQLIR